MVPDALKCQCHLEQCRQHRCVTVNLADPMHNKDQAVDGHAGCEIVGLLSFGVNLHCTWSRGLIAAAEPHTNRWIAAPIPEPCDETQ